MNFLFVKLSKQPRGNELYKHMASVQILEKLNLPLKIVCMFYYVKIKYCLNQMPNFMQSLLGKREHKFCKSCLGHMAKMAAIPIYGQNLYKSSAPEPEIL